MYFPSLFRIVMLITSYFPSHASPSFFFTISAIENSAGFPSFGMKSHRLTILISAANPHRHRLPYSFTAASNRAFPRALSTTTKCPSSVRYRRAAFTYSSTPPRNSNRHAFWSTFDGSAASPSLKYGGVPVTMGNRGESGNTTGSRRSPFTTEMRSAAPL